MSASAVRRALLLAGALGVAGFAREPGGPARPNVVVIVVDVGSWKLIMTRDGQQQYYDLAKDPAERAADALGAAERAALRRELARLGTPAGQQPGVARRTPADQERQRQLRGLGYTE